MELFECKHSLFLPRYNDEADNRVFIHKGSVWIRSNGNDRICGNINNNVKLERDNKRIVLPKKVFELYFRSVKAMTNRDKFLLKLIDMSDRELADMYCKNNDCRDCHFVGVKGCFDKVVDWLKQERDSDGRGE